MRLLFYTATAIFLIFAGVFGFYALQPSEQDGAAKVVLSIDANQPQAVGAEYPAAREGEPVEKTASRLIEEFEQAPEADAPEPADLATAQDEPPQPDIPSTSVMVEPTREQQEALASLDQADTLNPAASDAPATAEEFVQQDAPAEVQRDTSAESADAEPFILPGTTIVGFNDEPAEPEFSPQIAEREAQTDAAPENRLDAVEPVTSIPVEPETEVDAPLRQVDTATLYEQLEAQDQPVSSGISETPSDDPAARAEAPLTDAAPEQDVVPEAQPEEVADSELVDVPDGTPQKTAELTADEQELRANFNAFLTEMSERKENEAAQAQLTPPPSPARRPGDIPPPSKTAAFSGWAGQQISTNAVPTSKQPRVAILLRGVGRDDENSNNAVTKLPSAISLAFMPFSGPAQRWAVKAREHGHEVLIQLPLEPSDYPVNNPGPETLLSSSPADENLSRFRTILGRFDGYSGVTNYLGGKMLQSREALRPLLEGIKSNGLIYVGEGNNSHELVRSLAGELGVRYGNADIMIDSFPAPDAIDKALAELVALARKRGSAIGMGYASRTTIAQLEKWSRSDAAKGVTLVPVGALAQTPGAS